MWKAVKWLVLYIVVQFGLILGFSIYFTTTNNDPSLLGEFLNSTKIYLVIILAIIFIPLLLKQYKKFNIKENTCNNLYLYILFTVVLSISYNILGFYFDKLLVTNLYSSPDLIVGLISTVLIGPIIEELMFRGVMYNTLKNKFSIKKSALLTTILFTFSHFNLIQMFYTFIFGYFLIFIYEKYQNIKYPIILHMISNLTTTLICILIIKDYLILNIILLFLSIIILYIIYRKLDLKGSREVYEKFIH